MSDRQSDEDFCRQKMAAKLGAIKCIYYGKDGGWNFSIVMMANKLLNKGEPTLQDAWKKLAEDIREGRI